MADHDSLTRLQRRALAALLAERTIAQAAGAAKIPERTIYRYLALPAFRAALTAAESATIDEAGRRLLSGQGRALDTLDEIMTDGQREGDRRQAAATWLEYCMRWREIRSVEQRLAELEEAVQRMGGKHG